MIEKDKEEEKRLEEGGMTEEAISVLLAGCRRTVVS